MKRNVFQEIADFIEKSKVHSILVVKGARQVGKTYAVEAVLDQIKIPSIRINFEKNLIARDRIDKTRDFDDFTFVLKADFGLNPDKPQVLFIDEAQESEKLGSYIRFMKEEWQNTKVILTGSSTSRLFKKNQRVPVGRFTEIKISPFTFAEYLEFLEKFMLLEEIQKPDLSSISDIAHKDLLQEFDNYLEIGGMPQVLEAVKLKENFHEVRSALILSQKEDFISKTRIQDVNLFDYCLSAIANHVGSPSKYSEVSSSYHYSKEVISIMTNWLLIIEVRRQGLDPNKSDYLPKRYVYDLGVLRHYQSRPFQNVSIKDATQPELKTYLGGIFENAILIDLEKKYFRHGPITTWKKSSSTPHEVDFIIKKNEQFIPLECKASQRISNRSFVNVKHYLEVSKQDTGYVISAAPYKIYDTKKLKLINLPAYLVSRL